MAELARKAGSPGLALLRSSSRLLIDTGHVVDAGELNRQTTRRQELLASALSVQLPPGAPGYGFRYPHCVAATVGWRMSYGIYGCMYGRFE